MAVYFHGKVVSEVQKASTDQRVLLARLEHKPNFGEKISKADASRRIDKALKALAKGKAKFSNKVADGKTRNANKVGDATVSQRVFLARLEGKTNYGQKISFADASRRIAKLVK